MEGKVDLVERFPEIGMIALLGPEIEDDRKIEWKDPKIEGLSPQTEFLFCYGLTPFDEKLKKLLKTFPKLTIVFIEDRPERLRQYLETGTSELLYHENVQLRLRLPYIEEEEFFEELAYAFISEKIQICDATGDEKDFQRVRTLILRKATLASSVHKELLFYPRLLQNLHANFSRMVGAFNVTKLKNTFPSKPAIVCGAGPSLQQFSKELKACCDRALILAGGSTIVSLSQMGIRPHLCFAFDPNPEEYTRLRQNTAFDTPLIFGGRVQSDIFRFFAGPFGYASMGTGGLLEEWIEKKLGLEKDQICEGLSREALSVTTTAIQTAIYLGCDPIILVGVDLCYAGGQRYSGDIIPKMQMALEAAEDVGNAPMLDQGQLTNTKFLMERDVIDSIAMKYPEISLIDGSGQGLKFANLEKKRLSPEMFPEIFDVEGDVWREIVNAPLNVTKEAIQEAWQELKCSLERCQRAVIEILKEIEKAPDRDETAKMILYHHDLQEEIAYKILLHGTFRALEVESSRKLMCRDAATDVTKVQKERKIIFEKMQSIIADFSALC